MARDLKFSRAEGQGVPVFLGLPLTLDPLSGSRFQRDKVALRIACPALVRGQRRRTHRLPLVSQDEPEVRFIVDEPNVNGNVGLHAALLSQDVSVSEVGQDDAALANGFNDYDSLRKDPDIANLRKHADWMKTLEKYEVQGVPQLGRGSISSEDRFKR